MVADTIREVIRLISENIERGGHKRRTTVGVAPQLPRRVAVQPSDSHTCNRDRPRCPLPKKGAVRQYLTSTNTNNEDRDIRKVFADHESFLGLCEAETYRIGDGPMGKPTRGNPFARFPGRVIEGSSECSTMTPALG